MKTKRLITLVILLALVLSVIPATCFAAEANPTFLQRNALSLNICVSVREANVRFSETDGGTEITSDINVHSLRTEQTRDSVSPTRTTRWNPNRRADRSPTII